MKMNNYSSAGRARVGRPVFWLICLFSEFLYKNVNNYACIKIPKNE